MKINNTFTVHASIERAWALLTDVEAIAPCMPGAQLTGVRPVEDGAVGETYEGKVKVKMGPVVAEYKGTAVFVEKDDEKYHGVIDAKGRDSRGAGNASALISVQLRPDGDGTAVDIDTDLKISGKIAQFGAGMIQEVSEKLLGQFVGCLEGKLAAPAEPVAVEPVVPELVAVQPVTAAPAAEQPIAPEPVAVEPSAAVPAAEPAAPGPVEAEPAVSGEAPAAEVAANVPVADGVVADEVLADAALVPMIAPATATPVPTGTPASPAAQAAPATQAAPTTQAAPGPAGPVRRTFQASPEPEALDLLDLAGNAAFKRLLPVAIAGTAVVAAVIFFLTRR